MTTLIFTTRPSVEKPTPSLFGGITEAPPDPILHVSALYREDPDPRKVDLGVGAYRCEELKPYVFKIVRKVEEQLVAQKLYKEYLPIDGYADVKEATQRLVFGADCNAVLEKRIASAQSLSGTGGLRLVADFLHHLVPGAQTILLSKPTWTNHHNIFKSVGFKVEEYAYWDAENRAVDIDGMLRDLSEAQPGSAVVLHACAHNPTGMDPSRDQWKQILRVVIEKKLIPIFDMAYQGFASGDLDRDASAIRLFQQAGLEMFVCESFAKNLGLYGERVGMVHVVCKSAETAGRVSTQLRMIIRSEYSSPPNWGARILQAVLTIPENAEEWKAELRTVAERVASMRSQLRDGLVQKKTPGTWDHIARQIGMFSYTGLTPTQCERMVSKWHIYVLRSGRISLAGLNTKNLPYVIDAIDDCVRHA